VNSLNKALIYESAEKYIRRFGTRDPFAIADRLGIEVLFRNDFTKLKGLYRVIQRNRFIFLNRNLPEQVQTLYAPMSSDMTHIIGILLMTVRSVNMFFIP
jgi:hypothetical protein